MAEEAISAAYRDKLGRLTWPVLGGADDNAQHDVSTRVALGPFPAGHRISVDVLAFNSAGDVAPISSGGSVFVQQCSKAVAAAATDAVAQGGIYIPAGAQESFYVEHSAEDDGYLVLIAAGTTASTVRINDRGIARLA